MFSLKRFYCALVYDIFGAIARNVSVEMRRKRS